MAIIYSYPDNDNLLLTDMLIGTSTVRINGRKKNITKNFTLEALGLFIQDNFPSAHVQWGDITGTLSNQVDLQNALDSKQGSITLTTIGTSGLATLIDDTLNIPDYGSGWVVPTLQDVTDQGDTTTNNITVSNAPLYGIGILPSGSISFGNGSVFSYLSSNVTNLNVYFSLPDKLAGNYTLATIADIPIVTGFVPYTGATANVNIGGYNYIGNNLILNGYTIGDGGTLNLKQGISTAQGDGYSSISSSDTDSISFYLANGVDAKQFNLLTNGITLNDTLDYTMPSTSGTIALISDIPTVGAADRMQTIGRNSTGSTLYKGTVVYILGSTGNRPNFVKAQANSEATSAGTFGIILADMPNNTDGYAVTIGTIDNLDTRSTAPHPFTTDTLADGDTIYLSPTTAGYVTNVKPYAPSHLVYVGKVVRTSPTNGTIVYRIQNGYELDELHDVSAQTPSNNDGIFYESSTNLWQSKSIASALGYTPTPTTRTISTTSPLSGGGDLSADRTLSISQATTSTNGYLSSTDWNTFNSKGSGTVTSVSALTLGTTGTDLSSSVATGTTTPVITLNVPTASATNRGVLSSTDWSTFNGKFTLPSLTSGSVLFSNGTTITQDNANLFWDNTNKRLGIGTSTPAYGLDVNGTTRVSGDVLLTNGIIATSTAATRFQSTLNFFSHNRIASSGIFGFDIKVTGTQSSFWTYDGGTGDVNFGQSAVGVGALKLFTANTEKMRIFYNGNVGINTTTDAGYKLDVNGTARVSGNTSIVGSILQTHPTFTGTHTITFVANNQITFTNSGIGDYMTVGAGNTVNFAGQRVISTQRGATFGTSAITTGIVSLTALAAQSSGVINASGIEFTYAINNTGTYSGITRGIYYNPTLTSLTGTTHRAIETVTGTVVFGSTSGNVLLGTTTDAGYKLDVNGTARVSGTLTLGSNAIITSGVGGGFYGAFFNQNSTPFQYSQTFIFQSSSSGSAAVTSGSRTSFSDVISWVQSSGTADFASFRATPVISQTGTATGITRGLYINPTLTAAADWRAIEVTSGGAYINTSSVNSSAILQADSTTKGFLPPRMTTTQKNAIATPAAGLVVYDTTLNKLCVYTTAWETITSI